VSRSLADPRGRLSLDEDAACDWSWDTAESSSSSDSSRPDDWLKIMKMRECEYPEELDAA
jgi:hypothetical protein